MIDFLFLLLILFPELKLEKLLRCQMQIIQPMYRPNSFSHRISILYSKEGAYRLPTHGFSGHTNIFSHELFSKLYSQIFSIIY